MFSSLILGIVISSYAVAADRLPDCRDNDGRSIRVDNEHVLNLKRTTKNQYKDRAHIKGVLVGILKDRQSHLHLDVYIGESRSGTGRDSDIEIIYNKAFGQVRENLRPGMEVTACGDFINAFKQAGRYPPSPAGAILHWVHMSPRPGHQNGFMAIDGRLYGQVDPQDRAEFQAPGIADSLTAFWPLPIAN